MTNRRKIFDSVYYDNKWSSDESASGRGSELSYTKNLRKWLKNFINREKIHSIVDAPCGDFNWMRMVLEDMPDLKYTGIDICHPLILRNYIWYSTKNINFVSMDLVESQVPSSDLLFCRDFLFHLSFADIFSFLKKIESVEFKYLILTNHQNCKSNIDCDTGGFRELNLFLPPFDLGYRICEVVDDYVDEFPVRQMVVLKRECSND